MSNNSNNRVGTQVNVDIIYDGAIVGHGFLRSLDSASAFVMIRDFPLGADTFLELGIHSFSGKTVRVPVQLIENTGEGLEVAFECAETVTLTELMTR